jgi:hypothetical protein
MSVQVNIIGTFLLCFLLLPRLQKTLRKHDSSTHLEIVSSELYQTARRPSGADPYKSLNDPAKFGSTSQCSLTKLVELLICWELAVNVVLPIVSVVNPGVCQSETGRNMKAAVASFGPPSAWLEHGLRRRSVAVWKLGYAVGKTAMVSS